MAISFSCPNCNKTINANERLAGKKSQCPQCKTVLQVPTANAEPQRKKKKVKKVKKVVKKKVKKVKKKVRRQPTESSPPDLSAAENITKEPVAKTTGSNEKQQPVAKPKEEQAPDLKPKDELKPTDETQAPTSKKKKKRVKKVVKKVKKKTQPKAELPPPEEFSLAPDDDIPTLAPDPTVPDVTPSAPTPPTQVASVSGLTEIPAPQEGLTPVDDPLSAGLTPLADESHQGLTPIEEPGGFGGDSFSAATPVSNQPTNPYSAPASPRTPQPRGPMAPHRGIIWLIAGIFLFIFGGSGFGCGCCGCRVSGIAFLSWIQAFIGFLSFAGAVTCSIFSGLDLQKMSAGKMDPQGQVLTIIGLVLCILAALSGALGTCMNVMQAMGETMRESMFYAY